MASYSEFARFCSTQTGCDKGGLYAIQPRGLRGSPIKIGYSFNLLRRLADWEYSYPSGIDVLAVARMNRPNDTHFHKRRALQLAEALLKQELRQYVVAREEWLTPRAKAEILAAMRRLQLSLSPNLAGHFYEAAQIQEGCARVLRRLRFLWNVRASDRRRPHRVICGAKVWSQSARAMRCVAGNAHRTARGASALQRLRRADRSLHADMGLLRFG